MFCSLMDQWWRTGVACVATEGELIVYLEFGHEVNAFFFHVESLNLLFGSGV